MVKIVDRSELLVRVAGGREQVTITLRGEIDIATAPDFEERAMGVLRIGTAELVIDLSQVTFLSSAGLSTLIRISREADRVGCALVVDNPSPLAMQVIRTTGLAETLSVRSVY